MKSMIRCITDRIKNKVVRTAEQWKRTAELAKLRRGKKLRIMDSDKTIAYIIKHRLSVTRFGDGEFNIIFNGEGVNFQSGSMQLSHRLKEVLLSNRPDLLVCLPHAINTVHGLNERASNFFQNWSLKNYSHLSSLIIRAGENSLLYGDASMTRPYKDWDDPIRAKRIFDAMKQLWQDQDILFVEGEQTRLGIGNDLFANTRSVKRILAPAVNAFDHYEEILQRVLELHQGELVILALGPAATVLAYDLAVQGIRTLDMGHVDIEYEWYLRKATSKVAIPGKYTNEASDGSNVTACEDPVYLSQIIAKVGIP